jgi:hypothetical protein
MELTELGKDVQFVYEVLREFADKYPAIYISATSCGTNDVSSNNADVTIKETNRDEFLEYGTREISEEFYKEERK